MQNVLVPEIWLLEAEDASDRMEEHIAAEEVRVQTELQLDIWHLNLLEDRT